MQNLKKQRKQRKRRVEKLRNMKDLDARESRAEQILQSTSGFLEEGDKRMAKGLAEKDMDQIEAALKIIYIST